MKVFETFKARKVVLILLCLTIILMISISIVNALIVENVVIRTMWLAPYRMTMLKKLTKVMGPLLWIIMLVFAFIYTFNKKAEDKKIKWPFIVLVVIASITTLATLISVVGDTSNIRQQNIGGIFSVNVALGYVLLTSSIMVLGLGITNLVQVINQK